jgi:hypothetical protein
MSVSATLDSRVVILVLQLGAAARGCYWCVMHVMQLQVLVNKSGTFLTAAELLFNLLPCVLVEVCC